MPVKETSANYFAYGSNMAVEQLHRREVHPRKGRRARLEGFGLAFNKQASSNPKEGYANIVPLTNGVVEGILFEIAMTELLKLDRYEGADIGHYRQVQVTVTLDDGSRVDAVTYIAGPSRVIAGLKPTRAYLSRLLSARDSLSPEYFERLAKTETLD